MFESQKECLTKEDPADTTVPFSTVCNVIETDLAGSCIEADKLDYGTFILCLDG